MQVLSVLESSMPYLIGKYVHVLQHTYYTIWEAAVALHSKTDILDN